MAEKTGKTARGAMLPHLRSWRLYRMKTQMELARESKVGRSTITRAESGEPVSIANVSRLAAALKIKPQELMEAPGPDHTKAEPAA